MIRYINQSYKLHFIALIMWLLHIALTIISCCSGSNQTIIIALTFISRGDDSITLLLLL